MIPCVYFHKFPYMSIIIPLRHRDAEILCPPLVQRGSGASTRHKCRGRMGPLNSVVDIYRKICAQHKCGFKENCLKKWWEILQCFSQYIIIYLHPPSFCWCFCLKGAMGPMNIGWTERTSAGISKCGTPSLTTIYVQRIWQMQGTRQTRLKLLMVMILYILLYDLIWYYMILYDIIW